MHEVVQRLRPYMMGWKAYFGLAQTSGVWRTLDEWLRHRLRAIQLKQWQAGYDHVPRTASARCAAGCGTASGGKFHALVA